MDYQAEAIHLSLAAILGQIFEIQFPTNHTKLISVIGAFPICQTASDLIDS